MIIVWIQQLIAWRSGVSPTVWPRHFDLLREQHGLLLVSGLVRYTCVEVGALLHAC